MYALGDQIFRNKQRSARRNRNTERTQYVSYLTQGRDSECISQLRLNKNCFDLLCAVLRNRGLLADTRYVTVEEAVAEFLHTIAHNVRNRTNSFRFGRSGETISRHFHRVLIAVAQLAPDIIKQAGINTEGIPYFEDCVGAIDGTHVAVHVPLVTQGPFRNRKGTLSQNVMAACGFDLNFQYVHPGWEGSASDARVLQSSLAHADPLRVPAGLTSILMMPRFNYYVVYRGRRPGIYNTWSECKAQVHQFPDALYKGYTNIEEAMDNLHNNEEDDGHFRPAIVTPSSSRPRLPTATMDEHLKTLTRIVFILIMIICILLGIIVYLIRSV